MKRSATIGSIFLIIAALLLSLPALIQNREQKLEVYRAFIQAYNEGHPTNLSNVAHRFDADSTDVLICAPSALITTAFTRHFRSLDFTQGDFPDLSVRVVDPVVQRALLHANDPSVTIAEGTDIDEAVSAGFDAGLLQVSDIGFDLAGQRAMFTFSFSCGTLCGHSGTAMFERQDGRWVWSERTCGPVTVS